MVRETSYSLLGKKGCSLGRHAEGMAVGCLRICRAEYDTKGWGENMMRFLQLRWKDDGLSRA